LPAALYEAKARRIAAESTPASTETSATEVTEVPVGVPGEGEVSLLVKHGGYVKFNVSPSDTIEATARKWVAHKPVIGSNNNYQNPSFYTWDYFGEKHETNSTLTLEDIGIITSDCEIVAEYQYTPRWTSAAPVAKVAAASSSSSSSASDPAETNEADAEVKSAPVESKYSPQQLASIPASWGTKECKSITSWHGNSCPDPTLKTALTNISTTKKRVKELRDSLVALQKSTGILLQDNPWVQKRTGHIGASSTLTEPAAAAAAAPVLTAEEKAAAEAEEVEKEATRLAAAKARRANLDTLDFYLSKNDCSKGVGVRLAEKLGIEHSARAMNVEAARLLFKAHQHATGTHITRAQTIGLGIYYSRPTLYSNQYNRWTPKEMRAALKEKGIALTGYGNSTERNMRDNLEKWSEEHEQLIPKPMVKVTPKPKMKLFSAELITEGLRARHLKLAGSKAVKEERLLGWDGHADLVEKNDRCFICLDAFDDTAGRSYCPKNCGAGVDFASCSDCAAKQCQCSLVQKKESGGGFGFGYGFLGGGDGASDRVRAMLAMMRGDLEGGGSGGDY
jgi:hypothetical protein